MKNLTAGRIEVLASLPGVKRIAVENFLGTMGDVDHSTYEGIMANAQMDAMLYKWNKETVRAILRGITESFTKNTVG